MERVTCNPGIGRDQYAAHVLRGEKVHTLVFSVVSVKLF